MATTITEIERRALKRLAHHREVIVRTGNAGLTPAVIAESEAALAHHELLKVRVLAAEREARDAMIMQLCEALGAAFVQRVGHVATIYRPDPKNSKIRPLINPAAAKVLMTKTVRAGTERTTQSDRPRKPSPWKTKTRKREN